MKEQNYQSKIVKQLEARGAYVVKVVAASKKGVPDILACYKGKFIAIEVKTPTSRSNTTKLQDYNLALVIKAGGYSSIAVDYSDIDHIIEEIDNER